jgi:hypothetical protein
VVSIGVEEMRDNVFEILPSVFRVLVPNGIHDKEEERKPKERRR